MGTLCSPISPSDQEAQKVAASSVGCQHGYLGPPRPAGEWAQPATCLKHTASGQCHALSQAPVKIQGLCQMFTHSLHFSSL